MIFHLETPAAGTFEIDVRGKPSLTFSKKIFCGVKFFCGFLSDFLGGAQRVRNYFAREFFLAGGRNIAPLALNFIVRDSTIFSGSCPGLIFRS
ncbi:MAG: hypothetical protein DBX55_08045 [Verrucomicrobia bacterium]|nr:MAG: hypothetical protein DBX55_08045 [Verrucomicrobiota bacterium]